ncbi:MAG: histidine phosphatase family protein [Brachymonas sp.]|nr:histidine phosphatase family protein [Brachymonas sp.]
MSDSSHPFVTRITAIRHGETAWNVDTRIQGQLDISLNDTGLWQAAQAGASLAGEPIDAIISSDLSRAYQTALAVAKPHGLTVRTDQGLREREFGIFQGRTFAEIEAQLPSQALAWRKRVPEFAPEGGESLIVFRERVRACIQSLVTQFAGQHLVIVSHGGVMDVLYREATGLDLQAPRTWQLGNASINRLLWNGEHLSLVGWSDTSHLSCGLDEPHA